MVGNRENVSTGGDATRPAVFLDRDGTIIDETGYLGDPEKVFPYPGSVEALLDLQEAGYLLVVVTNQSGIARGLFTVEDAVAVNMALLGSLHKRGVNVQALYFCPHHPDDGCVCRKPETLMPQRAAGELGIDPSRSWMVGDTARDVLMGLNSGLRTVLVETGKENKGDVPEGTRRVRDLSEAVTVILEEEK